MSLRASQPGWWHRVAALWAGAAGKTGSSAVVGRRLARHFDGFTLIELMAVVAIVAIIAGLAAPALRNLVASQALRAQASDFGGAVRLARIEAIKRGRVVTLCRTDDASAVAPVCAGGSDWSSGWLLMQGANLIRVQTGYRTSGGIDSGGISSIDFLPTGIARGAAGTFRFRPSMPTTDAAYAKLTQTVCVTANGVTRSC